MTSKLAKAAANSPLLYAMYFASALNLGNLASVHKMAPLNFQVQTLRPDLHKITQLGSNRRHEA
jgi:hypothetical protein